LLFELLNQKQLNRYKHFVFFQELNLILINSKVFWDMMPSRKVHSLTGCSEDGDTKLIVRVGNYARMYTQ